MSTHTLPLDLFKANLEFQLRIGRLLQESGQRWLDAASRSGTDSLSESSAEIAKLLKGNDWQSLATLPTQAFWRQVQQGLEDTQTVSQFAIGNQAAFTDGLQQAVQDWQKTVTDSLGGAGNTQPFLDLLKQWGAAWTPVLKDKVTAKGSAGR